MKDKNNLNISTQQIAIFLEAVKLKNFTKVADKFNYTPSMVSKTITALEEELSLKLFIRKPHELTATPAALVLANEWRQFLGSFYNSLAKARARQEEMHHKIVFGFVDSSDQVDRMIFETIQTFMNDHPDITVEAEKHDMHRSCELLNLGMLDIIQTSANEIPYLEEHGLKWKKIFDSRVMAFVPKNSELYNRDAIDFSDIKKSPILSLDPVMHPTYDKWMRGLCIKNGFTPQITATCRTVRSLLFNLRLGKNIFIGDSITADWADYGLKLFPLPADSFSILAWRDDDSEVLHEFTEYLSKLYSAKIP